MNNEIKLDGMTAKEWATELFQFSYCEECGKDKEDHDIIPFLGHWFARCRSVENHPCERIMESETFYEDQVFDLCPENCQNCPILQCYVLDKLGESL